VSDGPTLRIVDERDTNRGGAVPAPVPPDDPEAWYAPDVRAQYEAAPGVVATVCERDGGRFGYEAREPPLSAADERALDRVRDRFSAVRHRRPLTGAGVVERAEQGFEPKYRRALDRLCDASAAARRRIDYRALRDLRLLGELTPIALDDRIEVADVGDDRELVVHTEAFAPLETGIDADADYVERVAAERLAQYAVRFAGLSVDVVVYRERLLGSDAFETKYAVLEPDLLPGDEALIEECKARIWETTVSDTIEDRESFVAARARRFLSRRLTARNTRAWLDAAVHKARSALADRGLATPPIDSRYASDRLDDLAYYVLRDFVGEGILTVPIRDPHLEDVEANRVGERVKVVPRASVLAGPGDDAGRDPPEAGTRVPTNLAFDDETTFVNVVTTLAARDGTELNASTPSAKVNLEIDGVAQTIRCAVALPVVSEGGPHVSIRKQRADALTPIELIERDALSVDLVTLLWLLYEHHGVVLFAGPTGVGKTTLLNAHTPFIPFDDRPISVDEGSREVRIPHETGVSLTTRDHEDAYKAVSMSELMTEANYLNPDVEVIAEINTPESFATFAESLSSGHGIVGTTHAADIGALVDRLRERDLSAHLLREVDLVVFPRQTGGERYVSRAVEPLSADEHDALGAESKRSPNGDPKRGGAGDRRDRRVARPLQHGRVARRRRGVPVSRRTGARERDRLGDLGGQSRRRRRASVSGVRPDREPHRPRPRRRRRRVRREASVRRVPRSRRRRRPRRALRVPSRPAHRRGGHRRTGRSDGRAERPGRKRGRERGRRRGRGAAKRRTRKRGQAVSRTRAHSPSESADTRETLATSGRLAVVDRVCYALFARHASDRRHDADRKRYRGTALDTGFETYLARAYGLSWTVGVVAFVAALFLAGGVVPAAATAVEARFGPSALPAVFSPSTGASGPLRADRVALAVAVAVALCAKHGTVRLAGVHLRWVAATRRTDIERTLPGAVRYLELLSSGSDGPRAMVRKTADSDAYGATATSLRKALNAARLAGSLDEGLRRVARDTPSRELLAPFLLKFRKHAATGDAALAEFLGTERRMLAHRQDRARKRARRFLELLTELFVAVLVLPALLVIGATALSVVIPELLPPVETPVGVVPTRAVVLYGAVCFLLAFGLAAAVGVGTLRPPSQRASYDLPTNPAAVVATAGRNPASTAVVAAVPAAALAVWLARAGYTLVTVALLGYAAFAVPVGVVAARRTRIDDAKDRELADFVHAVSGHVATGTTAP